MDVYQALMRFTRDGVLIAPGGLEALKDVSFSVEESMERAFEALDANDDKLALANALDAALGGDDHDDHGDHDDIGVPGTPGILARLGVGKRTRKDR